jgi:hypothetical protein
VTRRAGQYPMEMLPDPSVTLITCWDTELVRTPGGGGRHSVAAAAGGRTMAVAGHK